MKRLFGFLLWLALAAPASAQIVGTLPFTLQNNTLADANQVMADFNAIVSGVNTNAATAGANSNITSLLGLTTPLNYTAGGSASYIGGTSSHIGNAYTVASPVPTGFTLTAGKIIGFIADVPNTGATTLNVNATGATNFYRQTTSGPVPMIGGEIQANQVVRAYFDGTQYQCLNCAQQALVPTGTVIDYTGNTVPAGWLKADGSAVSRTTQAALLTTIAFTGISATTTIGNTTITLTVPSGAFFVGWYVGGTNVTCNSQITSVPDGTHIVINNAASASGATTLTIGPFPQGDCSTTFNLPNYTGRLSAGLDGNTNITAASCTSATPGAPSTPGFTCGTQTVTLSLAQLPTGITSANGAQSITVFAGGSSANHVAIGSVAWVANSSSGAGNPFAGNAGTIGDTTSFSANNSISVTSNNTSGTAHPNLPPVILVYKLIKT